MIRLERIVLREIGLPLVEPFRTSNGTVESRRILLLELEDSDGITSWSECVAESAPSYWPDTVDTCWLAITEWLGPTVIGRSCKDPREFEAALGARVRGHNMARAALGMGAWDIEALRRGISLATLLVDASDYSREIGAKPRAQVETGIALGAVERAEDLVARALKAASEGYRRIKLKISPGRDVAFVREVRAALVSSIALSVDANCSYTLSDTGHIRALESLDNLGLSMIEQPLAHDDLVQHADLQRLLTTPICLDESIGGDASVETMLALGSARIVNLKPGRVGGFAEAIAIHDRCAKAGIPVWCGGMLESGIGRAYNVALASLPNFTEPGDLSPSARYWSRDVVESPWTMDKEGRVTVPLTNPGNGVHVDEGFIDDLTVRRVSLQAG